MAQGFHAPQVEFPAPFSELLLKAAFDSAESKQFPQSVLKRYTSSSDEIGRRREQLAGMEKLSSMRDQLPKNFDFAQLEQSKQWLKRRIKYLTWFSERVIGSTETISFSDRRSRDDQEFYEN